MRICRAVLARIFVQEPVDRALGGASPRPGGRPCSIYLSDLTVSPSWQQPATA